MNAKQIAKWSIAPVAVAFFLCVVIPAFRFTAGTVALREDAPVKGLPPDASDIKYYFPPAFYPHVCYDFKTSEDGYRQWVRDRKQPDMSSIEQSGVMVFAYSIGQGKPVMLELPMALVSRWSAGDSGVTMAYDLDEGRAYFHSNSR